MIFNVSGGGGTALNFRVVGGTTAPANPAENCIWVNTETPITSWIFSAEESSPAEAGMVWFPIGTSSPVEFNALKKNGIQVYPLSAKQYVGGAWVAVTAKSYQGGAWVDWITYLYKDGEFFEDLTGTLSKIFSSAGSATLTLNETNIYFYSAGGNGIYAFANLFDLSGKSKLCCECKLTGSGTYAADVRVMSTKSVTSFSSGIVAQSYGVKDNAIHVIEVDISAIDSGYIGFSGTIASGSDNCYFTIYKMWLE